MNATERRLATTTREQTQSEKTSNSFKVNPIQFSKYFNFLSSIQIKFNKLIK